VPGGGRGGVLPRDGKSATIQSPRGFRTRGESLKGGTKKTVSPEQEGIPKKDKGARERIWDISLNVVRRLSYGEEEVKKIGGRRAKTRRVVPY